MNVVANNNPQAISPFISYQAQQLPKSNWEKGRNSEKKPPPLNLHIIDSYVQLFYSTRKVFVSLSLVFRVEQ